MARTYDVVLFGATGFTGKLVAEYLAKTAHGPWAIAGRNKGKLEAVRQGLGKDVPILVADADDEAQLEAIAESTRVVCTTVGPFETHGKKLVRACARGGTHYCDITGEIPFVRSSIDENHETAKETRARIVHCCGFDSIPFDLGVYMLFDRAKRPLAWAKSLVGATKGSLSGGTVASMMILMDAAKRDPSIRRLLLNTHALDPSPEGQRRNGDRERDQRGVRFDTDVGRWTAPFLMAVVNTRVVRRSNALLDYAYGRHFRYSESMSFASGPKGLAMASLFTTGLAGFAAATALRPTRRLLAGSFLPKPGEGPSESSRAKGYFKVRVLAETEDGVHLTGRVEGTSDPGYGETAKMLGESALCLALDAGELPGRFGVLTPASAMGMHLVERLRAAGMTFAVD